MNGGEVEELREMESDNSIYGNQTEVSYAPIAETQRRVVHGIPETNHFSGRNAYPVDSFVDPNSDYYVYRGDTDDEEHEDNFTFAPG